VPPTHLIFDLDNTLYAPDLGVVERVNEAITRYMRERLRLAPDAVDILRERYRRDHGTTLHGLMRHHQVEPDDYLAAVHAIEIDDVLVPDPALRVMLTALPHPKVIFTNASASPTRVDYGMHRQGGDGAHHEHHGYDQSCTALRVARPEL
jgi:putative hydrolase of the HAD superfamily